MGFCPCAGDRADTIFHGVEVVERNWSQTKATKGTKEQGLKGPTMKACCVMYRKSMKAVNSPGERGEARV